MHVQWLVSLGVPSRVCVLSTRAEFTRSINVNLTKRSQRRENPKLLQPATPQLTAIANRIMPPKASTDFPAPCMLQPSYQQGEASARRPIFVASPALATYVLWLACEYVRGIFENHFLPTNDREKAMHEKSYPMWWVLLCWWLTRCDDGAMVGREISGWCCCADAKSVSFGGIQPIATQRRYPHHRKIAIFCFCFEYKQTSVTVIMKISCVSFLAAACLSSTATAFTVQTPTNGASRTSVVLGASRKATKYAKRLQWLESRGFGAGGAATAEATTSESGVMKNDDGLEFVKLVHPDTGASSEIYLFGGVVTSYKDGEGTEFIAVRPDAKMDGSKPISGGLSHCWPQVSPPNRSE